MPLRPCIISPTGFSSWQRQSILLLSLLLLFIWIPSSSSQQPACGATIATFTAAEIAALLQQTAQQVLSGSAAGSLFTLVIVPKLRYGLDIRVVCAKCTDFGDKANNADNDFAICDSTVDYAADVVHSGLALFPINDQGQHVPGTHVGAIITHGTQSSTQSVPSRTRAFDTNSTSAPRRLDETFVAALVASMTASVTVLPDYTGYGESANVNPDNNNTGIIYRPYLVRRAYEIATLPLFYTAARMVREESDCQAAVANAVVVTGYSEGGFAAVAVAEGLKRQPNPLFRDNNPQEPETTIVKVFAGGAPFRLSSVQLDFSFRQMQAGTFLAHRRYYIALLGVSFSSTYPNVANFDQGQDWLSHELSNDNTTTIRQELIDIIHSGLGQSEINDAIPLAQPESIISPILVESLLDLIAQGVSDPCHPSVWIANVSDKICPAIRAQDLDHALETAQYPVAICHSLEDTLVTAANRPNFDANPEYLTNVEIATGGHVTAAGQCFFDAIQWYADDANVYLYLNDRSEKMLHSPTCPTAAPSSAPTEAMTSGVDATTRGGAMPLWMVAGALCILQFVTS